MSGSLLETLKQQGLTLTPSGDRLGVEGPLTDSLRQAIRDHKAELLLSATAAEVRRLLNERGWVAIESGTLGETVLFVRDRGAEAPEAYRGLVRYTLDELTELRGKDPEGLRLVHEVKKVFDGEIQPQEREVIIR